MFELLKNPNFNFLRWQWHWITASLLLILAGAVSLGVKGGPRLGIDFKGGTLVYVKFAEAPDLDRLRDGLQQQGVTATTIQQYGPPQNHEVIISLDMQAADEPALDAGRQAILNGLRTTYQVPADKIAVNNIGTDTLAGELLKRDPIGLSGQPTEAETRYRDIAERITRYRDNQRGGLLRSIGELQGLEGVPPVVVTTLEKDGFLSPFVVRNVEVVGPKVGQQLRRQALLATVLALAGMLIYIGLRFRQWVYGTAAVIATFHDVLITLGFLSLFNYEFDLNIVAAMLTLVGYSMNDTVVNFDRIRENLRLRRHEPFPQLVNRSLNETLSRTILTGLATLMSLVALFLLGGEVLKGFAFTLVVGIIVGTYSSIFIASPIVVGWIGRGKGRTGTATPIKVDRMPVEEPRVKEAGRKRR
ncbi:MAG TPA: protein translocase subunit SecF [Candidatus Xenobia bacterium]|nr:protein translocase subunit SecF [Candidatus Xenobia bacterium]